MNLRLLFIFCSEITTRVSFSEPGVSGLVGFPDLSGTRENTSHFTSNTVMCDIEMRELVSKFTGDNANYGKGKGAC